MCPASTPPRDKMSDIAPTSDRRPITRELAAYATRAGFATLPEHVRAEAVRAFTNWMGCAVGGCREPAVEIAAATVSAPGAVATIIGRRERADIAEAAFVNCVSSSVNAFDDAHLATVTHPSGPVASALFAFSETRAIAGEDFLAALALGIEIQCRLSNVLVLPPSKFNVGFYVTGLTAPIGTAAALGALLGLDALRMRWAMSLGASQASGFRSTHGTMTAHFRPGHAARGGVWAALLAEKGFEASDDALEADAGFVDVHASGASLERAVDGLGQHFELLSNAYKPYPCGIVIHPTVDACLDIKAQLGDDAELARVALQVHPLALKLTGVRTPATTLESHVSIYHWAAAALLRGAAGLPEMRQDCIDDPRVAALRARIEGIPSAAIARDEAIVEVTLKDRRTLRAHVRNARGSLARPLTDDELDAKFMGQAASVLGLGRAGELLRLCRDVRTMRDVGGAIAAALHS
jgi:2-methylcitrate dehydratase PrpD